jgi:hypothetical protein
MSKKNEGNITVYYDNGPYLYIEVKPSFRSRLRLIRHALFSPYVVIVGDLSSEETRWLFGRLGKVLRAIKRDQANA